MMTEEEERIRLLLDYLRELRALNDGGYTANKEIAEAVKDIRKLLGFDVGGEAIQITIDGKVAAEALEQQIRMRGKSS